MRRAVFTFSQVTLGSALVLAGMALAQMKPGDFRKAYGEARAGVIESVLTTLYPGAQVRWDPYLAVQMPGENPRMVEVPVYVRGAESGGVEGVATVDLEGKKEKFIFEAKAFQRDDHPVFSTVLLVYRTDAALHINKYKKLLLDPADPLTEIKTMNIQDWSQKEWPTLEIQYDTHVAARDSFTTIEWHSVFDANSGQFISRLPFGISRKVRGGPEQSIPFSIGRITSGTILLKDRMGWGMHLYHCSDPCVIDGPALLSKWVH